MRVDGGPEVLCAELPAGKFRKRHGAFKFRDRKHLVASARAIEGMRLKPMASGGLRTRTVGRGMDLRMPRPGGMRVTVGFSDPGVGAASNRCAVLTGALRTTKHGGLRYP